MSTFGQRMREARRKIGWGQKQLSEATGLTLAAISLFETGARDPSRKNLVRIANGLGCSVDSLLGQVDTAGFASPNEQHLLDCYRRLDAKGRRLLLAAAQAMATVHTSPTHGAPA